MTSQYPYDPGQYGQYGPYVPPPQQAQQSPQSGLGIASFVVALIGGLVTLAAVAAAAILEAQTPGGMDEESAEAIAVGCSIFIGIGLCLVAVILGIASLFQSDRRKVFGIIGLAIGAVAFVMTLLLLIIGLMIA